MIFAAIELVARIIVVTALVYALVVALTHWAVRSRRLSPFGPWPRLVRQVSDAPLRRLERRIIRSGGSPQAAPLWLVGLVVAGGLVLLSLIHWLFGMIGTLSYLTYASPRSWARFLVGGVFSLLMAALFVRVIASWLGLSPYSRWMRPVIVLTDWLLEPIRRVLPPFGVLDLSPVVAYLILWVVRGFLLGVI